jgi:GNAT superfamily N-acetyltransferase
MDLRLATPDDLPVIGRLREGAGWQMQPWAALDAMRAPNARFLLAVEGQRVVAMGSGIAYGALGVVGNMVVVEDRRRAGLGSAVLGAVLDFLEGRGVTRMELFATAAGRPLYERFGFEALLPGSTVEIPAEPGRIAPPGARAVRMAGSDDLAALVAYDLPRFGGNRSPILAAALADRERAVLLREGHGGLSGYAVLRGPPPRLGPWLADDVDAAAELLAAAVELHPGQTVTANLPGENAGGRAWLDRIGASLTWSDGRMARGPSVPRRLESVYGNAVGALG